ncbi:Oligoribonuclease [Buchnera aphidicola (Cinara kochiana kochiana)]|uniref:Oligoribonuclease n=1 Tax=Buchnera aphidicola (Cinara kochiana kochiana) TaxID=2518976 RepID=A0A451D626_9GAMM|nr:oligoribonuclease [Buchnera aphidicola]VFP81278.1 Oligoribonuclease [Buchnera aphidicola (Cinara kochiana kochiana)]
MKKKNERLIWIDLEMTGLNPKIHKIIEISTIITDKYLNIIKIGPNIVIFQNQKTLKIMNHKIYNIHKKNGLIKNVKISQENEHSAEEKTLLFLKKQINEKISPMCGNTISTDRSFLLHYMPKLESYFHYRNLDVSSINELVKRWTPNILNKIKKKNEHRAQTDLIESIQELIIYKKKIFCI